MREICYDCFRPKSSCVCRFLNPFDPQIKYVFLMHPKEAKRQRTGTGRIAKTALLKSEILVGLDFSNNSRLNEILCDSQFFPFLLYPAQNSLTAKSAEFQNSLKSFRKIPLALIIDSTWFCAKKILDANPKFSSLTKISFYGDYRSIFTFKREPLAHYLSTIESCYYLNKEFSEQNLIPQNPKNESLILAFKQMIKVQLQKENDRIAGLLPNVHATDWKYKKTRQIPDYVLQ